MDEKIEGKEKNSLHVVSLCVTPAQPSSLQTASVLMLPGCFPRRVSALSLRPFLQAQHSCTERTPSVSCYPHVFQPQSISALTELFLMYGPGTNKLLTWGKRKEILVHTGLVITWFLWLLLSISTRSLPCRWWSAPAW